jgi:hypothetical protein
VEVERVRVIEEVEAGNKRSRICEVGKGKAMYGTTSQKVFEGKAAMSQTKLLLFVKGTARTGLGWASLYQQRGSVIRTTLVARGRVMFL